MISFEEYKKYYLNYINRVLGLREQEFDCMDISKNEIAIFSNYEMGTKVLLLISFIEANFLNKSQLRSLRNFKEIDSIPNGVSSTLLSCFVYIRDCIAHNPNIKLLPDGNNTDSFVKIVTEGRFNFATIENGNIKVSESSIHHLHLTIRKFYERPAKFI